MEESTPHQAPTLTLDQAYSNLAAKLGHLTVILDDCPAEIAETKAEMRKIKEQAKREAEARQSAPPQSA